MTIKKWTYAAGIVAGFALVACTGENGADGLPGADGTSCVAKALKDGSGFDIICGDESVGTILNGEDGEDGAKGDKGDKGDKGSKGDKGDAGEDGSSCVVKSFDGGFKVLCDGDSVGVLVNGVDGDAGKTAFELAVEAGFEGTEEEWIASLKGETGVAGKTAYELAVEAGFEGTEEEWRASLKGDKGDQGETGDDGKSAYELAVEAGFEGTEAEWRASLKGDKGDQGVKGDTGVAGKSAYELAVAAGFEGTEADWRAALKGDKGDQGDNCVLSDNGDGTVTVACGKDVDPVTLYKAMCGATPYDPADKFCFGVDLYDYCGGEAYNADKQFCDTRDDKIYKYVKIGSQAWMAENLNYATEVSGSDSNSFCYGDGNTYGEEITDRGAANCAKYGRLYNINSLQNVCPAGWHLPTEDEFETLLFAVGNDHLTAGKLLKSAIDWSVKGSDAFGFSALPAGMKDESGYFTALGSEAIFWSSTPSMEDYTYTMSLGNFDTMNRGATYSARGRAYSVRCIKD